MRPATKFERAAIRKRRVFIYKQFAFIRMLASKAAACRHNAERKKRVENNRLGDEYRRRLKKLRLAEKMHRDILERKMLIGSRVVRDTDEHVFAWHRELSNRRRAHLLCRRLLVGVSVAAYQSVSEGRSISVGGVKPVTGVIREKTIAWVGPDP